MCYHCKELWHPDQTCDSARVQRALRNQLISMGLASLEPTSIPAAGAAGTSAPGRVGVGATPLGSFSSAGTFDGISRAPPADRSVAGAPAALLGGLPAGVGAAAVHSAAASFAALASCAAVNPGDLKNCPRCRTLIMKANDGSCNHMTCALCGTCTYRLPVSLSHFRVQYISSAMSALECAIDNEMIDTRIRIYTYCTVPVPVLY